MHFQLEEEVMLLEGEVVALNGAVVVGEAATMGGPTRKKTEAPSPDQGTSSGHR